MALIVFEHSDISGSARLGEALRDYGHDLRVIRLHRGEPMPVDLDDVHGVISCGGPQAPTEDAHSLKQEIEYLKGASDAGLPVLGICLGCQLLAQALGGEVGPLANNGLEIGWHEVSLTDAGRDDVLLSGIGWETVQLHWHRYQVTKVPPGARVLASSKMCPVQAWSHGLRAYAFQYHPEARPTTLDDWIEDEPGEVTEAGTTAEQLRQQTREYFPAYARLADRLFEQIALLLMPADRRYRGLIKDLMH